MSVFRATQPKWRQVHEQLRRKILNGQYRSGEPVPAQDELAASCGVSLNTAREAVAQLVREGLLVRAHGKRTVVADISRPVSVHVAVLFPAGEISGGNYPRRERELLSGLCRVGRDLAMSFHFEPTQNPALPPAADQAPAEMHRLLAEHDGLVVLPGVAETYLHAAQQARKPLVRADGLHPSPDYPQVTFLRRTAARMATEHVYRLGHRRLAFLGGPTDKPTLFAFHELQRQRGFLDVVQEHQLDLPPGWFIETRKELGALRAVTLQLLEREPRPTAICCSTDRIAAIVLSVLLEQGVRVPDDVALVSFIRSPEWSEQEISLSGVTPPFEAIGAKSAELLRQVIDGEPLPPMPQLLEPRLVVAQSCGGARAADEPSLCEAPLDE